MRVIRAAVWGRKKAEASWAPAWWEDRCPASLRTPKRVVGQRETILRNSSPWLRFPSPIGYLPGGLNKNRNRLGEVAGLRPRGIRKVRKHHDFSPSRRPVLGPRGRGIQDRDTARGRRWRANGRKRVIRTYAHEGFGTGSAHTCAGAEPLRDATPLCVTRFGIAPMRSRKGDWGGSQRVVSPRSPGRTSP